MILLDTHVAIWMVRNDPALGKKARDAVLTAARDGQLAISAISFWEIALLIAKGRLRSADDPTETRRLVLLTGVRELPLTGEIAIMAVGFAALPADPADRFIVATAVMHEAVLMTADESLLSWRSKMKRINAEL